MKARYVSILPPSKVRALLRSHLAPAVTNGGHRLATDWQRSIPHDWPGQNGTPTGNSARSITVRQQSQLVVAVGSARVSVKSLEEGARPHIIRPKRYRHGWKRRGGPGLLAWPEERGGASMPSDPPGWRLRKIANHPGVKARGYGALALARQRASTLADLKAALARIP